MDQGTNQNPAVNFKAKDLSKGKGGAFAAYRRLMAGDASFGRFLWGEMLAFFIAPVPGALGLALRKWLYPSLFKRCGRGVVFGRNLLLRHAHKIELGDGVILDDNVMLDAKGEENRGISLGDGVYVGRNTLIYCKNGNIRLGRAVNVASNCQIFSSNELSVGDDTVIAAYVYLLSGGSYDVISAVPFAAQTGMNTRGPTRIGGNCWLGAGVVVVDGAEIGDHAVIGAGAVVTGAIPGDTLALGVPAKPVRRISPTA